MWNIVTLIFTFEIHPNANTNIYVALSKTGLETFL